MITQTDYIKLIRIDNSQLYVSLLERILFRLEMCIGIGIPWALWDSHRNGNKISHEMGMGCEWELRRVVGKTLHTVTNKHLQQCLCWRCCIIYVHAIITTDYK